MTQPRTILPRLSATLGLVLLLAAAPASAQLDGFRADRFEMAPTVEDGMMLRVPDTLGHLRYSLTATLGLAATTLRVTPDEDTADGIDVVGTRLSTYLGFALGLSERFELNLDIPIALAQASEAGMQSGFMIEEAGTTAFGDMRIGGSVLAFGDRDGGPQVGVSAMMSLPTGSEDSFTGDGGVGFFGLINAGYVAKAFQVVVNAGARIRPEADYVTSNQGTEFIARGGVLVPIIDNLTGHVELDALLRSSGDDAFDNVGSPLFALLGARYALGNGIHAGAGIGFGLTIAPSSPRFRALATVSYSPEKKKEVIPPPPPILDTDGDGYLDPDDACPLKPEDFDEFEDQDGCPEADNDNDKILDGNDRCPRKDGETIEQTAEVYNNHEDEDGCPDVRQLTLEEVVTLPAPIEFEYDKAVLLPGSDVYLGQVLDVLQKHPEVEHLEVQGHTSSEGGPEYNLELSDKRARAVVKWLVDRGVAPGRLVAKGYGLTQPVAANDTEENRQKNRRVQFRLVEGDKLVPVPSNAPGQPAPAAPTAPRSPTPPPAGGL